MFFVFRGNNEKLVHVPFANDEENKWAKVRRLGLCREVLVFWGTVRPAKLHRMNVNVEEAYDVCTHRQVSSTPP